MIKGKDYQEMNEIIQSNYEISVLRIEDDYYRYQRWLL